MTPSTRSARAVGDILVSALLAAQALRLLSAIIGGFATIGHHDEFGPPGRFHTGVTLTSFGGFADGVGVLLLIVAVVMIWWRQTVPSFAGERPPEWQSGALTWLLALTAVGAVLGAVGAALQASVTGFAVGARLAAEVGFEASYVLVALAAMVAVGRLETVGDTVADADEPDDAPAAVFAVDRKTGAVLAWRSRSEARDKAPLFGVVDDEYDWFLDDGEVLRATAAGRDVTFTPTGEHRPDDLVQHLKEHALRRGLAVDDDEADEPLAYVDPIVGDHYLELWPGWLRWLGRLTR